MRVKVEYMGDNRLVAHNEGKQTVLMGWGEDQPIGMRPMEVVLAALGACSAVDVVEILRKMRREVRGLSVELEGERVGDYPRVYSNIRIIYKLYSSDASEKDLEKAVKLSMEKYCSVAAMLRRGGVAIDYTFKLEKTE